VSYDDAMQRMSAAHAAVLNGPQGGGIFVLEHDPVITLGRRMAEGPFDLSPELERRGVAVRRTDRGGLLTYHGPGQAVVYFVLPLAVYHLGIADFVKCVADAVIAVLLAYGIECHYDTEHPGVWVRQRKIASIGMRVSQGVTLHGVAINITNDLTVYHHFDPCGMTGDVMTNLAVECPGRSLDVALVGHAVAETVVQKLVAAASQSKLTA
jgi:lipoate-protein ligase B